MLKCVAWQTDCGMIEKIVLRQPIILFFQTIFSRAHARPRTDEHIIPLKLCMCRGTSWRNYELSNREMSGFAAASALLLSLWMLRALKVPEFGESTKHIKLLSTT